MIDARTVRIAEVERQLAELDAVASDVDADLVSRHRRGRTPSVAFSVRLDTGELAALERRAAAACLKPSVLARNLIRSGLRDPAESDPTVALAEAVDRLEDAVALLRSLIA